MNYANFQRTISLYKVLKISSIKALKTDSFFEQIFIPILNTLPFRARLRMFYTGSVKGLMYFAISRFLVAKIILFHEISKKIHGNFAD